MRMQFEIDMQSTAMRTLSRLSHMDEHQGILMRDLAAEARDRVRADYLPRFGSRGGTSVRNLYKAIKEEIGSVATTGLFTGSTLNSIIGSSTKSKATVDLKGRWPNRHFGDWKIPLGDIIEKQVDVTRALVAKMTAKGVEPDYSGGHSGPGQLRERIFTEAVTVKISRAGLEINWPPIAEELFGLVDIVSPGEPFATKTYKRWSEYKATRTARDFMLLSKAGESAAHIRVGRFLRWVITGDKYHRYQEDKG